MSCRVPVVCCTGIKKWTEDRSLEGYNARYDSVTSRLGAPPVRMTYGRTVYRPRPTSVGTVFSYQVFGPADTVLGAIAADTRTLSAVRFLRGDSVVTFKEGDPAVTRRETR